jgi:hypothetical protein
MKSGCFIIHPGKIPPPQNGCQLKSEYFQKNTGFTSSTFSSQPDCSQNQPAAITLNTGSPWTLWLVWTSLVRLSKGALIQKHYFRIGPLDSGITHPLMRVAHDVKHMNSWV